MHYFLCVILDKHHPATPAAGIATAAGVSAFIQLQK